MLYGPPFSQLSDVYVVYSEVSNKSVATPIYLGIFSKKIYEIRLDFLCSAQKFLCNTDTFYLIRHFLFATFIIVSLQYSKILLALNIELYS